MSIIPVSIRRSSAAVAVACVLWSGAFAAPADAPHESRGCGPDGRGPPRPPPMGPEFGPEDRPPPYLIGVSLSEDQQDKVFSILHAAAPEMREHSKAARKAREALRALGESTGYDAGKAASLAQALGSAEGQLALLRARTDREIFQLLTPEQRTRATEGPREAEGLRPPEGWREGPPHGAEGQPHGAEGPPPPR